jgi:hypothetical protein
LNLVFSLFFCFLMFFFVGPLNGYIMIYGWRGRLRVIESSSWSRWIPGCLGGQSHIFRKSYRMVSPSYNLVLNPMNTMVST